MSDRPAAPDWLRHVEDHHRAGEPVILTGNTRDRIYAPGLRPLGHEDDATATEIPPRFLPEYLASYYANRCVIYYLSLDLGLTKLTPPGADDRRGPLDDLMASRRADASTFDLIPLLTSPLRSTAMPMVLLVDNAQHLAGGGDAPAAAWPDERIGALETFARWPADDDIRRSGNLIILISHDTTIHPLLSRQAGYRTVTIPLPGYAEREAMLHKLGELRASGRQEYAEIPEASRQLLATESGGLLNNDLIGISRQAAANGSTVDRAIVRARKEQNIAALSEGLLTLEQGDYGLDQVAGQVHAREALLEIVQQWQGGDRNVPKGIALVGPPGQGKSYTVRAFGRSIGLPVLRFQPLHSPLVGESENRQQRAFWVIQTLAPVILFIDEVDQAMGKRSPSATSGDSGTSERMFGEFLRFFGSEELRGRVIFVVASNFPMAMDAALLDRINMVIPLLPPGPDDVAELVPVVARQLGIVLAGDVDPAIIANLPNLRWPSVRMLAEILATARRWAAIDAHQPDVAVDQAHLLQAASLFKPNYDPATIERISLEAVRMTSSAHLLPWMTRWGRRAGAPIPSFLEPLVDEAGMVRSGELHRRLTDLAAMMGG